MCFVEFFFKPHAVFSRATPGAGSCPAVGKSREWVHPAPCPGDVWQDLDFPAGGCPVAGCGIRRTWHRPLPASAGTKSACKALCARAGWENEDVAAAQCQGALGSSPAVAPLMADTGREGWGYDMGVGVGGLVWHLANTVTFQSTAFVRKSRFNLNLDMKMFTKTTS